MNKEWHTISNLKRTDDGSIVATIQTKDSSNWFKGHFPGEPIMPGVAQLIMAADIIKKINNKKLKFNTLKRIKFRHLIKPGDRLQFTLTPGDKDNTYLFSVKVDDITASNGIIIAEEV